MTDPNAPAYNEPWQLHGQDDVIRGHNGKFLHLTESHRRRLVACVNAMTGISDPAAFVKAHKELVEAVKEMRQAGYPFGRMHRAKIDKIIATCAKLENP